jgi:hypothetical protein
MRKGAWAMVAMRAYSRKSFFCIFLLGVVLLAAVLGSVFYAHQLFAKALAQNVTPEMPASELIGQIDLLHSHYIVYAAAGLAAGFIVIGLILWFCLRRIAARSLASEAGTKTGTAPKKLSAEEGRIEQRRQQRLFLHLLAMLQREGRLVDFLNEDLEQYEDDQIGAAVRGIHENCKRTITKNLALQPIIDHLEGEETEVAEGFDPHAVKLTGNVSGRPPFVGILRHRGWRTDKIELPTLSDVSDAGIIAPAEVEIL